MRRYIGEREDHAPALPPPEPRITPHPLTVFEDIPTGRWSVPIVDRRLAVVCFAPALGHVMPLLRIADQAREAGFEVRAFLPAGARTVVSTYGFEAEHLPPVPSAGLEAYMREHAGRSRLVRAVLHPHDFHRAHGQEVEDVVLDAFPGMLERVRDWGPTVILADEHRFGDLYRILAAACGVPLAVHGSEGSLRDCQPTGVRLFGPVPGARALSRPLDVLVRAGLVGQPRWWRLARHRRWRRFQDREERLAEARRRCRALGDPERASVTAFGTGLGVLEARHLAHRLVPCPDRTLLGPVPPLTRGELPAGLRGWLESEGGPVLVVSFGTMVRPTHRLVRRLAGEIRTAGARSLWVTGAPWRDDAGEGLPADPRRRMEEFAPLPDLLAHPRVRGLVTHAGAGGIQEALWFGKPLLTIPFLWDQPYNARVVEALGAGRVVKKGRLGIRKLPRAVRTLLDDDALGARARELSAELRSARGGEAALALLEELADDPRRER